MYNREDITLRGIHGADAAVMLRWENDPRNWHVSNRSVPLTKGDIESLIETQNRAEEISDLNQYRYLVVASKTGRPLGAIDIYEANWETDTAYVGILIAEKNDRRKNAGYWALHHLMLLMDEEFDMEYVYARIQPENSASIRLFEKAGFEIFNEVKEEGEENPVYFEYRFDLKNR